MFSENSKDDNTYIQYKGKNKVCDESEYSKMIDEKHVKTIKENIKLYNVKTQKEENLRPKYMTEYFSNRINKNKYIPCEMKNETTSWGIIVRKKDNYVFKLFTTGAIATGAGKIGTGQECTFFNKSEMNIIINELNSGNKEVKKGNKEKLCNYIADILMSKNKLILYPLYKPKDV
jgi:hypothetical protein